MTESKSDIFHEKLELFKNCEKAEVVLLVAKNYELIKMLVAWRHIRLKRKATMTPLSGESEQEIWDWLWDNVEYEENDMVLRSGAGEHSVKRRLPVLIGNRLIYPDGTINRFAERYLRERVLSLFQGSPGR